MHAVGLVAGRAGPQAPGLLGREAEHRRQPQRQIVEQERHHRARGAPARTRRRIAIERILADVEIEGRQIDGAEIMDRGIDGVELVVGDAGAQDLVRLGHAMQHPALELRHVGRLDALGLREALERAQQIAQRVAQPAIEIGLVFQDLGPDAQIFGIVGAHDP
jgi:hypothetical protein